LASRGCQITVFTTNANGDVALDTPTGVQQQLNGVDVTYFPRSLPGMYFLSAQLASDCLRRVAEFDLIYVYSNWGFPFLPVTQAAFKASVAYVVSPRNSFRRRTWDKKFLKKMSYHCLLERRLINHASALHFTTDIERRESNWLRLRPSSFVVPNAVDLTEFEKPAKQGRFRRALELGQEAEVILYLGRLDPGKGLDIAMASFAKIAARRPMARLVLVGPEENGHVRDLKALANRLGIGPRTLFPGYLDSADRLNALADADIFLLTSYSENFGMSVVESMAAGLPAVISDQVGISEDLQREEAAIVVPLDPDQIANALDELLASVEMRKAIGRRAKSIVHRRYSPHRVAQSMLEQFEAILDSGKPLAS
jgi:glycosyltransferase involved in cell wall biosynthesis